MTNQEPAVLGMFICQDCQKLLPALAFGSSKKDHNGIKPFCRDCGKIRFKSQQWYQKKRQKTVDKKLKELELAKDFYGKNVQKKT